MCVYVCVCVCVNQTDYWLVQYQRLMDRKPDSLIDRVCVCMYVYVYVVNITKTLLKLLVGQTNIFLFVENFGGWH